MLFASEFDVSVNNNVFQQNRVFAAGNTIGDFSYASSVHVVRNDLGRGARSGTNSDIVSGPNLSFSGIVGQAVSSSGDSVGTVAFEVEDVNMGFFKWGVVSPSTTLVS